MITQTDIARRLGLSQAAVASVVGSYTGRRLLKPELEEKVRRLAEQLGYRPHRQAQQLRGRKSGLIGILQMGERGVAFTTERVVTLEDAVHEAGYDVLTCDVRLAGNVHLVCERMLDARVEGIMLAVPAEDFPLVEIRRLRELKIPLVTVSGRKLPGVPRVIPDVQTGMKDLTAHLIRSGRRRLALLTVTHNATRMDGFRDALQAAGGRLADNNAEIWPAGGKAAGRLVLQPTPPPGQTHAIAAEAARKVLDWPDPPDAIVCSNDDWALAALSVCGLAGVKVPVDMAVTGFDGSALGAYYHPPLTTVAQPIREMARQAMDLLGRQIRGEKTGGRGEDVKMPCRLVVRASCGTGLRTTESEGG
jgi:LacI family transcriptional regulator